MNHLGERISISRKKKKMTQQALAAKLFVADKTVSSWESGRTEPSLEMILKISELLECSLSYLLYGDVLKNDIETEIKVKLTEEEFKNLDLIMENKGIFIKEVTQKDSYYSPDFRNFINQEYPFEWLSIRERGGKNIVNYKHWYPEGEPISTHCDEFEVEIDDIINMKKIFKVLNLNEIAVVAKKRKTYFYEDKYEVALDKVEELGYFVEIEVKKYEEDPITEYEKLLKVAKKLNLNLDNIDRRGYPYYFIER